jgi:hypothetical protein
VLYSTRCFLPCLAPAQSGELKANDPAHLCTIQKRKSVTVLFRLVHSSFRLKVRATTRE